MATSHVTTRKATARQQEMQLKSTLKELQNSKALCEQLLQEREDIEIELQKLVDKNSALKYELGDNDMKLIVAEEEVTRLQHRVDSFNQCASAHEVALQRITNLEQELGEARDELDLFRRERERYDAKLVQNLYQELVGSENKDSKNLVFFNSSKKLKKYVKINRYIRRTQKLIKSNACIRNYTKVKSELSVMKNRVMECNLELDRRELDSQKLQKEICKLKDKLESTSLLYSATKMEYKEHVLAFTALLDQSKENEERFYSLVNNHLCTCRHSLLPPAVVGQNMALNSKDDLSLLNHPVSKNKTIIISDQIGSGLGSMLSNILDQHVTNYCYPNVGMSRISELLLNGQYDHNTNLVILFGNSYNVDKPGIDKLMSSLNIIEKSGIGKIIISALPYSQSMSHYMNNKIAHLNSLLYHATCFNNKYHFFDINKFIKRFTVTSLKVNITKQYLKTLVDLLAYNIQPNRCNNQFNTPQQIQNVREPLIDFNLIDLN